MAQEMLAGKLAKAAADAADLYGMRQAVAHIVARLYRLKRRPVDLHLGLQAAKRA